MSPRTRTAPLLILTLSALALTAPPVFASPAIATVTVTPSPARAGQPVRITVSASDAENAICGLTVHWDDGQSERAQKVGDKWGGFPRSFEHTYARPGRYIIKAEGQRAGTFLPCGGEATVTLLVEAAAMPTAQTGTAAPSVARPACPAGWTLKGKAGKDGSFTCAPKKGAGKPEQPLACPAGTSYFVSNKALGCEKAP